MRLALHLLLHAAVPAAAARIVWPRRWLLAWGVMLATMVVDVDHLLADPILDPNRCSVGFHPLHSLWAVGAYAALMLWPRARWVATGLLIHMALDGVDCLMMTGW